MSHAGYDPIPLDDYDALLLSTKEQFEVDSMYKAIAYGLVGLNSPEIIQGVLKKPKVEWNIMTPLTLRLIFI